jgi:hypothetical protein
MPGSMASMSEAGRADERWSPVAGRAASRSRPPSLPTFIPFGFAQNQACGPIVQTDAETSSSFTYCQRIAGL